MRERNRTPLGLRTVLGLSFAALAVVVAGALTLGVYPLARAQLYEDVRARLRDSAALAAARIDARAHARLRIHGDESRPEYASIEQVLGEVRRRHPGVSEAYTLRIDRRGRIVFGVSARDPPARPVRPGEVYENASPFIREHLPTLNAPVAEPSFHSDRGGARLTGYAPFYTQAGRREGVVAIDMQAAVVLHKERKLAAAVLLVFAAVTFLALVAGWVMGARLARPILALERAARAAAEGRSLLPVPTGGPQEVHDLGQAFNQMATRVRTSHDSLHEEIEERVRVAEELEAYRKNLQKLVQERTSELSTTILKLHREVRDRRQAEHALRDSEERVGLLLESTGEGIFAMDREGRCILANPACARLLGYEAPADLVAEDIHALVHHSHSDGSQYPARECRMLGVMRDGQGVHVDDELMWRRDGSSFPAEYRSYPLRQDGAIIGVVITFNDITQRKRAQERLAYAAEHDYLSGLPNRGMFMDRLRTAVARARRSGRSLALLYVDLDEFKPVNDRLGHQAGDEVLKQVAQRLAGLVREADTVARIGGDEFGVILEGIVERGPAESVAAKIEQDMQARFTAGGTEVVVGASIGIALYPQDGTQPSALLSHADQAMYQAKRLKDKAARETVVSLFPPSGGRPADG